MLQLCYIIFNSLKIITLKKTAVTMVVVLFATITFAQKMQEIFLNFFLGDLVNFHQNEKSPGWWAEAFCLKWQFASRILHHRQSRENQSRSPFRVLIWMSSAQSCYSGQL